MSVTAISLVMVVLAAVMALVVALVAGVTVFLVMQGKRKREAQSGEWEG